MKAGNLLGEWLLSPLGVYTPVTWTAVISKVRCCRSPNGDDQGKYHIGTLFSATKWGSWYIVKEELHTNNTLMSLPVFERMSLSLWRFYCRTSSNMYTQNKYLNFTVDTVKRVPIWNISKTLYGLQRYGKKAGEHQVHFRKIIKVRIIITQKPRKAAQTELPFC